MDTLAARFEIDPRRGNSDVRGARPVCHAKRNKRRAGRDLERIGRDVVSVRPCYRRGRCARTAFESDHSRRSGGPQGPGDRYPAEIISAHPAEMPGLLCDRHVGLCIVQPSFSKLASAPTRMAEHLACGAPVLVTAGVGDMKAITEADSVGAAFDPDVPATLSSAASDLKDLLADPTTPGRCRATAEAKFSATAGSAVYASMYGSLLGRGPR